MGLRQAVAVNMLDMIGVGPFLTLPLLLGAMGGPQALLGWICGALLAVCDGLVWAELGAAMPEAGGTYQYLRRMFPGTWGRFLGFLFCAQLLVSAPLSIASGGIGLGQYGVALLGLRDTPWWQAGRVSLGPGTLLALLAVALAVALLWRGLGQLRLLSYALWTAVIGLLGWIFLTALLHGHLAQAFTFPPGAWRLDAGFWSGLAAAMLVATYDFWGYYNVCFLAGEVRDPGRTVPRAVLWSIALVTGLYLLLHVAVLSVLPWRQMLGAEAPARRAMVSTLMQTAYGGQLAAKVAAALVMVAAFASLFSLMLGYSRIPYAAARDGNFPAVFGRLHARRGFPYVALLSLGGVAAVCCFFSLAEVIAALVILRIVVQFLLQHVGILVLRRRDPGLDRPFRVPWYPLPPLLALLGFAYVLLGRPHFWRALAGAGVVLLCGALAYALWHKRQRPGTGDGTDEASPGRPAL